MNTKTDLSSYNDKTQVKLILQNNEFIQLFNSADNWEDVKTYIDDNFILCNRSEVLGLLEMKFNQQ